MLIIPAVDIKGGCVVRLVKGRLNQKIYSRDPLKAARHWVKQGAKLIHVVDLDGATSGIIKNLASVKNIATSVDVPVQFGGGARSLETVKKLLSCGVWRVVLGTKAQDLTFLKKALAKFKSKVIVSLDVQDGKMRVEGWQSKAKAQDPKKFAQQLKKIGFKELIYTDISKDGTLSGPNIQGIKSLLKESGMKIIASGGIASLDDILRLELLERQGLSGIIVGKALYEGKFTLTQALRL